MSDTISEMNKQIATDAGARGIVQEIAELSYKTLLASAGIPDVQVQHLTERFFGGGREIRVFRGQVYANGKLITEHAREFLLSTEGKSYRPANAPALPQAVMDAKISAAVQSVIAPLPAPAEPVSAKERAIAILNDPNRKENYFADQQLAAVARGTLPERQAEHVFSQAQALRG